jgi:hypothetical protein
LLIAQLKSTIKMMQSSLKEVITERSAWAASRDRKGIDLEGYLRMGAKI